MVLCLELDISWFFIQHRLRRSQPAFPSWSTTDDLGSQVLLGPWVTVCTPCMGIWSGSFHPRGRIEELHGVGHWMFLIPSSWPRCGISEGNRSESRRWRKLGLEVTCFSKLNIRGNCSQLWPWNVMVFRVTSVGREGWVPHCLPWHQPCCSNRPELVERGRCSGGWEEVKGPLYHSPLSSVVVLQIAPASQWASWSGSEYTSKLI